MKRLITDSLMGASGAEAIVTGLGRNRSIIHLNLAGANLGDAGMQVLSKALGDSKRLQLLSLERNGIRDAGLAALSDTLRRQQTLQELYIGGNSFKFRGMYQDSFLARKASSGESFGLALRSHPTLTVLDLSYNNNSFAQDCIHVTDALKFNHRIISVGLCGVLFSDDGLLNVAELLVATPQLKRTLDLSESGLEGNIIPLVTALRMLPCETTLIGVDFGNVSIVNEMAAHVKLLAKLLSRPGEITMPNTRETDIFLLDGRQVVLEWQGGKFHEGRVVYGNGDELTFHTIRNRGLHGDGSPDMLLMGQFLMEDAVQTINMPKIAATVSSVVNLVDYAFDLIVLVQLYNAAASGEQEYTLFVASLAILLFANLYTMYSLWQDGRGWAALLQPFSLTIVVDAYNFVCLGRVNGASMPLRTTQPMQGLAAIHRLKLTEAMMEATPQTLLQSYQAILNLAPDPILYISIAMSLSSIVASLAQSDKAKMNAWRKSFAQKQVRYFSWGVLLAALFRAAEIGSNVVTVSLFAAFFSNSDRFYVFLFALLGAKVLLTLVYWRFNLKHFGDAAVSLFVFPGSDEVCLEWIKDVQRLPVVFYTALQVVADGTALAMMGLHPESDFVIGLEGAGDNRQQRINTYNFLLNMAIAVVILKYLLAGLLCYMHSSNPDFLYTDRRHQISCGKMKRKNSDAGDTLINASAKQKRLKAEAARAKKDSSTVLRAGPGRMSIEPVCNPLRSVSDPMDIPSPPGGEGGDEAALGGGNSSDNPAALGAYKTARARRMSGRVLASQAGKPGPGNSVLMGSAGGHGGAAGGAAGGNTPPSPGPEAGTDFESSTGWMRGPEEGKAEAASDAGKVTTRRQQRTQASTPAAAVASARSGVGSVALGIGKKAVAGKGVKGGQPSGSYRRASVAVSRQQQAASRFAAERAERAVKEVVADVDVDEL